jgi:hypothetical protein
MQTSTATIVHIGFVILISMSVMRDLREMNDVLLVLLSLSLLVSASGKPSSAPHDDDDDDEDDRLVDDDVEQKSVRRRSRSSGTFVLSHSQCRKLREDYFNLILGFIPGK